jgi:WhiB family redox-sensing transcriptional regulator
VSIFTDLAQAIPLDQAACADANPELFFAPSSHVAAVNAAKAICNTCPVAHECLAWAMKENEYGIWGGLTEEERSRLRRKPTRTRAVLIPSQFDASNKERANRAAERNIVELKKALEVLGQGISGEVRELINLRINNPSFSLEDIGQHASVRLTKDQVRSKLRTVVVQSKRVEQ